MRKKGKKSLRLEAVKDALAGLTYDEMMRLACQMRNWAKELDFSTGAEGSVSRFEHDNREHFAQLMGAITEWDYQA